MTREALLAYAVAHRDMAPHIDVLTANAAEATTIIEFGVRGGVSTWAFLDGLPPDGTLWSVDVNDCTATVPAHVRADARWRFIHGDDRVPSVLRRLPDHADIVFIDTSHEYHHTRSELEFALTRTPGRILCHDADWPGVAEAIAEFTRDHRWRVTRFDRASDKDGPFSLAILEPR